MSDELHQLHNDLARCEAENATLRADLAAAQSRLAEAGRWQPIETAPKDGAAIDLWVGNGRITDCRWGRPDHECGEAGQCCDCCPSYDGWVEIGFNHYITGPEGVYRDKPTHWQPLPKPPELQSLRRQVQEKPI